MQIAYIGNFEPAHSTENHVARALTDLGHQVARFQENRFDFNAARLGDAELVLWTRTWRLDHHAQRRMLRDLKRRNVPTVAFHLDRWWGLSRQHQVHDEPFFRCDLVVTADGGHDTDWAAAGVNHVWMPPAVARHETEREGRYADPWDYDVVFVGGWAEYHPEWAYRGDLVRWLLGRYPRRFRPVCCDVRGQDLANLYATARVVIGDSCLAGGARRYWSDRIPETLGRGGFLIHPDVEGLAEQFTPGVHLATYPLGDWDALGNTIDWWLAHPVERRRVALAGQAHVRARHLYEHRLAAVVRYVAGLVDLSEVVGPVTVTRGGIEGRFEVRRAGDGIVLQENWNDCQYGWTPAEVKGRVVLDVGANIGAFTVWCALAGAAHVWAYEPDPANRAELEHNLGLNQIGPGQVTIVPEAVHCQTGDVWLAGRQGSVRTAGAPELLNGDQTLVVGRHINEVLERVSHAHLMKMDCEGCEYAVFEAVDPGHLRRVDRIAMEFHAGPQFLTGETEAPGAFGRLVTKLADDGTVHTLGHPTRGGLLHWWRYGA